ncbi:hypothetical protein GCM10011399_24130 [Subtercola lobariae]|uniref:Uncharacterized protein n=1 Tax=Subtercola lobariae TaxID=1588641 RepID=A0A917BBF3_9MICO|nr:hypothetical protein GCM10011399_24130 [Subtercola lobariae]
MAYAHHRLARVTPSPDVNFKNVVATTSEAIASAKKRYPTSQPYGSWGGTARAALPVATQAGGEGVSRGGQVIAARWRDPRQQRDPRIVTRRATA